MKIVAFLQNMWVRNPERVRKMIAEDDTGELRERLIVFALFRGCLTGRRLKNVFGEDLCNEIVWEEASPVIDDNPKRYHVPVPDHIRAVLAKHQPDTVLCFTLAGSKIVGEICASLKIRFISAPHPAARQPDTIARLKSALEEVRRAP
jgi:hypothetical protein